MRGLWMRHLTLPFCLVVLLCDGQAIAEKRFWIVKGPELNCTIVETEPTPTQTAIQKLGKSSYDSRKDAEEDLDRVCELKR
jgi:hypothetical protein